MDMIKKNERFKGDKKAMLGDILEIVIKEFKVKSVTIYSDDGQPLKRIALDKMYR